MNEDFCGIRTAPDIFVFNDYPTKVQGLVLITRFEDIAHDSAVIESQELTCDMAGTHVSIKFDSPMLTPYTLRELAD